MQEKPESLRERKSCNKSPPQSTKKKAGREERARHIWEAQSRIKRNIILQSGYFEMEIRKTETESCL